ncbi:MAG: ankyrin repeat domain-containing protein [Pseudomonadota bacterium]
MPQDDLNPNSDPRSASDILASLSDSMFPAECGEATIFIDTHGYDDDTPLHVLLWRGDTQGVRILIEAGADVNALGEMSETPLHVAVTKENLEAVRLLLAAGADCCLVSEFGKTPKERAAVIGLDILTYFPKI